jgi:uncharacterized protein (TIGR02001 family)
MRVSISNLTKVSVAAAALVLALAPAMAQDASAAPEEVKNFTLTGSVTAVSDYRFRGVSLSDEKFALQPSLTLTHKTGLYVGTWVSNLGKSLKPVYGRTEVDLYAGWTGEVTSGTTVDAAVVYYLYPDGTGKTDYFEPYISVSHAIGPVTAKAGVNYAPPQAATGENTFTYIYGQLGVEIPSTPITLTGRLGRQDLGPASYTEWAIGATASYKGFTAGLQYVDTNLGNLPNVDAGLVASLSFAF